MRTLLLALLLMLLSTGSAQAFCRSTTCNPAKESCQLDEIGCKGRGQNLWWRSSCVGLSVNDRITTNIDQKAVSGALDRALKRWSNVTCDDGLASFAYGRQGTVRCGIGHDKDGPNANVLYFRDDGWPYQGLYDTLGYTTVHYIVATGEIIGADIEINTGKNYITVGDNNVQNDFESIITHELGHALGLSHSHVALATMRPSYDLGDTTMRHLVDDDREGACAIYPPGRETSCDLTPSGGFTDCRDEQPPDDPGGCQASAGSTSFSLASLLALALTALVRRRRAAC